jgi:hypothetical protein
MHPKGGRKRPRRGIHSFVHLESLRESLEMRFGALGEASLGTCFHGESSSGLEPCLFVEELPVLRRAHLRRRAH